jgi:hypothetical protein
MWRKNKGFGDKSRITFASHSIPMTTISSRTTMVMLPIMRTSCIPPSTIWREKEVNKSSIDSQKPTTYIAHATALAKEKINPMDPPNSGPRDLDIIKYVPPPVTEIENQHRDRKKAVKIYLWWFHSCWLHSSIAPWLRSRESWCKLKWELGRCLWGESVNKSCDNEIFFSTRLTDDPTQAKEQHDAPNIQQTSHQHSFDPSKL